MTSSSMARYDDLATWYDDYNAAAALDNRTSLIELLVPEALSKRLGIGLSTIEYRQE